MRHRVDADTTYAADELRNAAHALREMAGHVTPGPWTVDPDGIQGRSDVRNPAGGFINHADESTRPDWPVMHREDALWIAATGPCMAESLAALLEACADNEAGVRVEALTIARRINDVLTSDG